MSDLLKVNIDEMYAIADNIKNASKTYSSLGNKPFDNEVSMLSSMNTDFTAKYLDMIEDLNDNNPELCDNLNEIAELTNKVANELDNLDKKNANALGGK